MNEDQNKFMDLTGQTSKYFTSKRALVSSENIAPKRDVLDEKAN